MDSTTSETPESTLQQLRARVQQRLQEVRAIGHRLVPPNPPPRYDEIFSLGQQWLDQLAFEPDACEEVEP